MMKILKVILILLTIGWLQIGDLSGQTTGTGSPGLRIDVSGTNDDGDFGVAIQLVIAMTILTLGPSIICLLYTSPSPRDKRQSRMPSSA